VIGYGTCTWCSFDYMAGCRKKKIRVASVELV